MKTGNAKLKLILLTKSTEELRAILKFLQELESKPVLDTTGWANPAIIQQIIPLAMQI
jgi:hypothetical protein